MALTEQQVKELKKQLSEQIKDLPDEQKTQAQAQIDSMSAEALETMLKQQQSRQQVFRMIANKEIESVVVEENSKAIAVLEINPLSRGHILVIPKEMAVDKEKMPKDIVDFASAIAKKVQKNLKPSKVDVKIEQKFGEVILEIVPEYDVKVSEGQRKGAKKEELEEVKKEINRIVIEKPKPEKIKIKKPRKKEVLKLKRRIP